MVYYNLQTAVLRIIHPGLCFLFFTEFPALEKIFSNAISNNIIKYELEVSQKNFHCWGRANRVVFDAIKEKFHILKVSDTRIQITL